MSFADDLRRFQINTDRKLNAVVKKIVIDMGSSIVYRTPVGNPLLWQSQYAPPGYVGGRARANWQYGRGQMPTAVLDSVDKSGSLTVQKIIAALGSGNMGTIHWIANSLPYIKPLEEGWSSQAPSGMLRLTVTEFQQTVDSVAKEFK